MDENPDEIGVGDFVSYGGMTAKPQRWRSEIHRHVCAMEQVSGNSRGGGVVVSNGL